MKKTFLSLFELVLALTALFVSCSDNNSGDEKNDNLSCKITVGNTDGGSVKITNYGTLANVLIGNEVEVVAVPESDYDFLGWYVGDSEHLISTDAVFTFTASNDIFLLAKFSKPEAIDLGLSVKWASCNVGASNPEDYGGYYAWGEIERKDSYKKEDYLYYYGDFVDIGSNISGTKYDVAHVKWGGDWRMPTIAELQELLDNCDWTWTIQNGVNGYKVTASNGNSIFLPATGYRYSTDIIDRGSYGCYWSSLSDGSTAYCLRFNPFSYKDSNSNRNNGLCVRPVTK